jgi:hypothetical protein
MDDQDYYADQLDDDFYVFTDQIDGFLERLSLKKDKLAVQKPTTKIDSATLVPAGSRDGVHVPKQQQQPVENPGHSGGSSTKDAGELPTLHSLLGHSELPVHSPKAAGEAGCHAACWMTTAPSWRQSPRLHDGQSNASCSAHTTACTYTLILKKIHSNACCMLHSSLILQHAQPVAKLVVKHWSNSCPVSHVALGAKQCAGCKALVPCCSTRRLALAIFLQATSPASSTHKQLTPTLQQH